MNTTRWSAAGYAVLLCASTAAWPQAYPAKIVRVIVPFPPAGANDIAARIVMPKLSEYLGQSFIIENRPGAGGTIGTALVAQSKPDGYTLLIQTVASHVANAHLYNKLPYDALRDFTGVSPMARVVSVLTVHPALPVKSVKEFVALAKAKPGTLNFSSPGLASTTFIAGAQFRRAAGIDIQHVPYKSAPDAVTDRKSTRLNSSH